VAADFADGATIITSSAQPDDDPRGDELVGGVALMVARPELLFDGPTALRQQLLHQIINNKHIYLEEVIAWDQEYNSTVSVLCVRVYSELCLCVACLCVVVLWYCVASLISFALSPPPIIRENKKQQSKHKSNSLD
jgi:hypothetical protein